MKKPHTVKKISAACFCVTLLAGAPAFAQTTPTPSSSPMSSSSNEYQGFVLSSSIANHKVLNRQNEQIGTISNLIINPVTGNVRFAVVNANGNQVLVPWSAFDVQKGSGTQPANFTLNISKDKLAKAPKFDSSKLSSLYTRTMEEPVFVYYDIIWFPDTTTPEQQNARNKNKAGSTGTSTTPSSSPSVNTTTTGEDMSPSPSPH
ncbi:MAG: PRC-barrel domain-containing protein [Chthoniobacterales bacterium]